MCPPSVCSTRKYWAVKSNSDMRERENEDSLLAGTKGDFPESDNPVNTDHSCHMMSHEEHVQNLFTSVTYAPCLTGPAKGLAAGFGVFLSVRVMVFLPTFTQNSMCHLWVISHIWRRQFWSHPSGVTPGITWSGRSFVFFVLCSVTLRFLQQRS